jgi:hypothetical protein
MSLRALMLYPGSLDIKAAEAVVRDCSAERRLNQAQAWSRAA